MPGLIERKMGLFPINIFLILVFLFSVNYSVTYLLSSYYEPRVRWLLGDTAVNRIIPNLCSPEVHVLVGLPRDGGEGSHSMAGTL